MAELAEMPSQTAGGALMDFEEIDVPIDRIHANGKPSAGPGFGGGRRAAGA